MWFPPLMMNLLLKMFLSLGFLMLMRLSHKISMEVVTRRTSMLRLGLRMLSINSESFGVMKLKKLIANLSKDENFVMALVDMLSIFVLQVAKKDGNIYPPTM